MSSPESRKARPQLGCLILLVIFSGFIAVAFYPQGVWKLAAALGSVALICIFLKVGWWAPWTVAGTYFGMFILDPPIKGGDAESMMRETATAIVAGTVLGFLVGIVIDAQKSSTIPPATEATNHDPPV